MIPMRGGESRPVDNNHRQSASYTTPRRTFSEGEQPVASSSRNSYGNSTNNPRSDQTRRLAAPTSPRDSRDVRRSYYPPEQDNTTSRQSRRRPQLAAMYNHMHKMPPSEPIYMDIERQSQPESPRVPPVLGERTIRVVADIGNADPEPRVVPLSPYGDEVATPALSLSKELVFPFETHRGRNGRSQNSDSYLFSDPVESGSVLTGSSQQELLRRKAREETKQRKERKFGRKKKSIRERTSIVNLPVGLLGLGNNNKNNGTNKKSRPPPPPRTVLDRRRRLSERFSEEGEISTAETTNTDGQDPPPTRGGGRMNFPYSARSQVVPRVQQPVADVMENPEDEKSIGEFSFPLLSKDAAGGMLVEPERPPIGDFREEERAMIATPAQRGVRFAEKIACSEPVSARKGSDPRRIYSNSGEYDDERSPTSTMDYLGYDVDLFRSQKPLPILKSPKYSSPTKYAPLRDDRSRAREDSARIRQVEAPPDPRDALRSLAPQPELQAREHEDAEESPTEGDMESLISKPPPIDDTSFRDNDGRAVSPIQALQEFEEFENPFGSRYEEHVAFQHQQHEPMSHFVGHPAEKHAVRTQSEVSQARVTGKAPHVTPSHLTPTRRMIELYPDPPLQIAGEDDSTIISARTAFVETVAAIVIQAAVRRYQAQRFVEYVRDYLEAQHREVQARAMQMYKEKTRQLHVEAQQGKLAEEKRSQAEVGMWEGSGRNDEKVRDQMHREAESMAVEMYKEEMYDQMVSRNVLPEMIPMESSNPHGGKRQINTQMVSKNAQSQPVETSNPHSGRRQGHHHAASRNDQPRPSMGEKSSAYATGEKQQPQLANRRAASMKIAQSSFDDHEEVRQSDSQGMVGKASDGMVKGTNDDLTMAINDEEFRGDRNCYDDMAMDIDDADFKEVQKVRNHKAHNFEVEAMAMDMYVLAAIRIQSAFRGFWARDCVNVDHYCATAIQKEFRRFSARQRYHADMWSIILVQSLVRRSIAQENAANLLAQVIGIQAIFRGYRIRKRMKQLRAAQQTSRQRANQKVPPMITTSSKGSPNSVAALSSRHTSSLVSPKQSPRSTPKGIREDRTRRFTESPNIYDSSATIIQTRWRTWMCETQFIRDLVDILIVQTVVRRWLAEHKAGSLRMIQKAGNRPKSPCASNRLRTVVQRQSGNPEKGVIMPPQSKATKGRPVNLTIPALKDGGTNAHQPVSPASEQLSPVAQNIQRFGQRGRWLPVSPTSPSSSEGLMKATPSSSFKVNSRSLSCKKAPQDDKEAVPRVNELTNGLNLKSRKAPNEEETQVTEKVVASKHIGPTQSQTGARGKWEPKEKSEEAAQVPARKPQGKPMLVKQPPVDSKPDNPLLAVKLRPTGVPRKTWPTVKTTGPAYKPTPENGDAQPQIQGAERPTVAVDSSVVEAPSNFSSSAPQRMHEVSPPAKGTFTRSADNEIEDIKTSAAVALNRIGKMDASASHNPASSVESSVAKALAPSRKQAMSYRPKWSLPPIPTAVPVQKRSVVWIPSGDDVNTSTDTSMDVSREISFDVSADTSMDVHMQLLQTIPVETDEEQEVNKPPRLSVTQTPQQVYRTTNASGMYRPSVPTLRGAKSADSGDFQIIPADPMPETSNNTATPTTAASEILVEESVPTGATSLLSMWKERERKTLGKNPS